MKDMDLPEHSYIIIIFGLDIMISHPKASIADAN